MAVLTLPVGITVERFIAVGRVVRRRPCCCIQRYIAPPAVLSVAGGVAKERLKPGGRVA